MRTLEENRYKKTYASDARRVSWLVNNNLSEDYEAMPISMRKKWPKAAYKRERFLAKEYVKHQRKLAKEAKQKIKERNATEAKLRESIRKIVGGLINEQKLLKELKGKLIVYGPHFHPEQLNKQETLEINGTKICIYEK